MHSSVSWSETHVKDLINNPNPDISLFQIFKGSTFYGGFNLYSHDRIARVAGVSGFTALKKLGYPELLWQTGVDYLFEVFNLHRLETEVLAYNIPSLKLCVEYTGFQIEGVKKESCYKLGRYHDSIQLGLLRSCWIQSERLAKMDYNCHCGPTPDTLKQLKAQTQELIGI